MTVAVQVYVSERVARSEGISNVILYIPAIAVIPMKRSSHCMCLQLVALWERVYTCFCGHYGDLITSPLEKPYHCVNVSEVRLYSGSIDFFFVIVIVMVTVPPPLLYTYSIPNSPRALTFAIELCTSDREALTITASLLQPLVFQAHYCK